MSSGLGGATGGGRLGVGEEGSVDDVGQAALEGAASFARGVAGESATLQVGDGIVVATGLGDRDPVQRSVELAVPGSAEAVSGVVAGPDR